MDPEHTKSDALYCTGGIITQCKILRFDTRKQNQSFDKLLLVSEQVTDDWCVSGIVPIYKKKVMENDRNNYGGIYC